MRAFNPASASDDAAIRLVNAEGGALCTIVAVDGSFSRDGGAQLAISPRREMAGSLSDHCLEQDLATQAVKARRNGQPILLRYGKGSPAIDFRLPCGAGLDILVDPQPNRQDVARACADLDRRRRAALNLPAAGGSGPMQRIYTPPLRLVLFGSGLEVAALETLSLAFGIATSARTPGAGIALHRPPDEIPVDEWTAIVLLFHDHEWEEDILAWALGTTAFYIGSIGGRLARAERMSRLAARQFDFRFLARVKGPIGLIESARDPSTLALSILSEVVGDYERLRRAEPLLSPEPAQLQAAE